MTDRPRHHSSSSPIQSSYSNQEQWPRVCGYSWLSRQQLEIFLKIFFTKIYKFATAALEVQMLVCVSVCPCVCPSVTLSTTVLDF